MPSPSAIWQNYCYPLTLKNSFAVLVFCLKKSTQHSIIWRWAVFCKKQDGGRIKICETFSGNSLKEDLLIDTTFDPCKFSWGSPFKITNGRVIYTALYVMILMRENHYVWGRINNMSINSYYVFLCLSSLLVNGLTWLFVKLETLQESVSDPLVARQRGQQFASLEIKWNSLWRFTTYYFS